MATYEYIKSQHEVALRSLLKSSLSPEQEIMREKFAEMENLIFELGAKRNVLTDNLAAKPADDSTQQTLEKTLEIIGKLHEALIAAYKTMLEAKPNDPSGRTTAEDTCAKAYATAAQNAAGASGKNLTTLHARHTGTRMKPDPTTGQSVRVGSFTGTKDTAKEVLRDALARIKNFLVQHFPNASKRLGLEAKGPGRESMFVGPRSSATIVEKAQEDSKKFNPKE